MPRKFPVNRRRTALLVASAAAVVAVACASGDDPATAPAGSAPAQAPVPVPSAAATATATPQQAPEPTATPTARPATATASAPTATPTAAPTQVPTEPQELPPGARTEPLTKAEQGFIRSAQRIGWRTNFDIRAVSLEEIFSGGVPRDGIPPVDNPTFTLASKAAASYEDPEPVIALELNGDARAYPLRILQQHEIVNDEVGGEPVVVTFCPLCNSALAFRRTVNSEVLRFGVSGLLRNSDLVMWDNKTESFWQQLTGAAIVGDQVGNRLEFLAAQTVSFAAFKKRFPEGRVLDPPTRRNYARTPYTGYDDAGTFPFLFLGKIDPRLDAVTRVAAFDLGTGAVAYSFPFLAKNPVVNDRVGETPIVIFFDNETESAFRSIEEKGDFRVVGSSTSYVRELDGQTLTFREDETGAIKDEQTGSTWDRFGRAIAGELDGAELDPVIHGDHFWFAWSAFKPDTRLIESLDQVSAG